LDVDGLGAPIQEAFSPGAEPDEEYPYSPPILFLRKPRSLYGVRVIIVDEAPSAAQARELGSGLSMVESS
jgi:hypothetical protein